MKKLVMSLVGVGLLLGGVGLASGADLKKGEKLFRRYCSFCHPDGGNTIRSERNLKRDTLIKNGITSPEGIIEKMRRPGRGMPAFSEKRISPEDAESIAHYIWEAFKD
ncbi:c-type cytochrome [Thermosulfurimonas dismutans]|uniref:Cytochrome C553 (Soluble cytochrome f) n=1 Tax=Thermosulfurimonas dismutans TaxID=999894 RepID=A0A179D343_9BACT|nr:c-type cytochrome [Thermosulfurimonas dismutans]OAQ20221.1 Cytochrome C553 (soluble cytochrome f) [Thermosulfurimonas dismutans]